MIRFVFCIFSVCYCSFVYDCGVCMLLKFVLEVDGVVDVFFCEFIGCLVEMCVVEVRVYYYGVWCVCFVEERDK